MPSQSPPLSLYQKVLSGTKWYVGMRWSIKLLGLISSAIVARLLVPEDFGLIASVFVIVGFVSLFFQFGVNWALIQNNKATDEDFYTAWTIRILQSIFLAILLIAISPLIAYFLDDIRLKAICQIMALSTFVGGFQNIGVVKLQKDMSFSRDFVFHVAPKIISTCLTIGLAFYYKSYMALVLGSLFHNTTVVIFSYIIVSFRPKLSLSKASEIWGFSQWMLLRNIADYISLKGDLLLLAAIASPAKIGFYQWGTELSFMAISEVQQPFSRALVPGLVAIKDDHGRLIAAYLKSLSMMTIMAIPITLGFGGVAEQVIPIFLGGGDKWLPVVPLIEALVFFAMCTSMYSISINLLTITGSVKSTAYIYWIQAFVSIATLYPAYYLADIEGVAYARVIIGMVMFFLVSLLVIKKCEVKAVQMIASVWRPVAAGIGMYVILLNTHNYWELNDFMFLALKISGGATSYIVLMLSLWYLSGKPKAVEDMFIRKVKAQMPFIKI